MTTMMTGGRRGKIDDGEERGGEGRRRLVVQIASLYVRIVNRGGSIFNACPVQQVVLLILWIVMWGVDFNARPV